MMYFRLPTRPDTYESVKQYDLAKGLTFRIQKPQMQYYRGSEQARRALACISAQAGQRLFMFANTKISISLYMAQFCKVHGNETDSHCIIGSRSQTAELGAKIILSSVQYLLLFHVCYKEYIHYYYTLDFIL